MASLINAPTVVKVLAALSQTQLARLKSYSAKQDFHHGRLWFGPDKASPLSVAFNLTRDDSAAEWRGARVDSSLFAAMKHLVDHAGGEVGVARFMSEIEKNVSPAELKGLIDDLQSSAPTIHSDVVTEVTDVADPLGEAATVKAPTVAKVLGSLSSAQLAEVQSYAQSQNEFSMGAYWHSQTQACVLAIAFHVSPEDNDKGWWGAKMDGNLFDAFKYLVRTTGGEVGADQFIYELENKLTQSEMRSMINHFYQQSSLTPL